jgi:hypothetical protein
LFDGFLVVTFYKIIFIDRKKITKDMTNEDREDELGFNSFLRHYIYLITTSVLPKKNTFTLDNGKCSTQMP